MREYGQFCPVAQTAEFLTERWTPLLIRELLCGTTRFNDLHRGVPLMSTSLLSKRLKSLERVGIIQRKETSGGVEYRLTEAGHDLGSIIDSMGRWGQRWADHRLLPNQVDTFLLMWDIHRRLDTSALPQSTTVLEFRFPDAAANARYFWLLIEGTDVELCFRDPGREPHMVIEASSAIMAEVWLGHRHLDAALRSGGIALKGPRPLRDAFPRLLKLSVFADAALGRAGEG